MARAGRYIHSRGLLFLWLCVYLTCLMSDKWVCFSCKYTCAKGPSVGLVCSPVTDKELLIVSVCRNGLLSEKDHAKKFLSLT